jgi:hypothetical protein
MVCSYGRSSRWRWFAAARSLATRPPRPSLDSDRLVAHVHRLGNRTVFKRLGFILEESGIDAAEAIRVCRENISAGLSPLDPTVKRKGRIVKRWNLRVNADFRTHASDRPSEPKGGAPLPHSPLGELDS